MKTDDPDNISELLHEIVMRENEFIHSRLSDVGLNVQQARLLKYVDEHPGTIQKNVASFLNRQNATVTNMLKSLTSQDYLVRKIPADNERQKQLFLKPKGHAVIKTINQIFAELETTVKSAVDEDRKTILTDSLGKIKNKLQ
ncbi:MarR family transcriptional regulator [Paucilactobacillus suebicus]|uniref:MarR family transcriptional regulator n=1 Tax=Paucilactobacillus suebicus DSM 5007 = KCTC 3549 TaxID=1423807 RepID=A0A0R1WDJ6_9LACO|nr:MarR family transcriptional regulator [Paucilactobacillus suebicus]KRM12851.1 MarR family transcriptional regulator [Paucilactobacillus suebicus DSM 5007 = KCTC 3549]